MTRTSTFSFRLLALGLPLLIVAFTCYLSQSVDWMIHPQMSLAITLDLLLTIPLIYLLLAHKAKLPKFSAISFLILGIILANVLLPADQQQWLKLAEFALVPIEIGVFTFILLKVRKIIVAFRKERKAQKDFLDLLLQVCKETLGDNIYANLITYEISFFYYGLIRWKPFESAEGNNFTYHKKSGISSMYIAMLLLFFAEAATVHLLIMKYSVFWANIVTGLTIYTIFQLLAHLKAIHLRPIQLLADRIIIRHGLAGDVEIPLQQIKSIEINRRIPKDSPMLKKLAGDLQPHNVVIELQTVAKLRSLYGIQQSFQTLCLFVDEKDTFVAQVKASLS